MEKEMGIATPKRIAITGPESTGKSQLCKQLANYYNEPWVPEYSREYLSDINGNYGFGDILAIAHGQFERESKQLAKARHYLFCDTDFLVTHIWCLVKYGKSHEWIKSMALSHPYDYTLLCNNDLPWEYDPLRENPDSRDDLFKLYFDELTIRKINFGIVEGVGAKRFEQALELLNSASIKLIS
jgi:NadR type nicotinamide-nucleotide adenylyltransferase